MNYEFHANQGPEVKVAVEGVKISKSRLHLLVPIYQEGTIDNDLLNEGVFNIRDYVQQQGYFDCKVEVRVVGEEHGRGERGVHGRPRGQTQSDGGKPEGQ